MELDFSKMKWQIQSVPIETAVTDFYPELGEIFKEYIYDIEKLGISPDKFIRFVVLVYHKNSPLVEKLSDLSERKREAMKMINADIEMLLKPITNEKVAYCVLQFLKFENSRVHKKKMMYEEALSKNFIDLIEATGTERKNIPEAIERLEAMIAKCEDENYHGETTLGEYSESFDVTEKRKIYAEEQ